MKHLLLRNAFTLKALLLIGLLVSAVSGAWAQESTLTEGFENATTSTSYQGTVTVTEKQSDCGIGWEIFYGTVSTSSKITGNNSAAMRLYAGNDNYGYLKTTTPIEGLTNVAFKIKAANSNSASIKVIFSYSSDGTTWTDETAFTPATSAQDLTRPIPAGNKYIKFAISSTSTKPSKSNAQLTIDDVVFTYSNTDPSKEDAGLSFGETTIYNVSYGETFTAPTLINPNNLEVTYESGNNDVARVDENTGEITIVGGGEAIITASSAETDLYNAGRASYTLNVTDNRIATRISYGPIELDLADVATLTKLAPVVSDSEDNIIEYTYGEWPTEVSFEIVSDPDCMIGSLDNNSGDITLNAVEGTATIKAYYNYYNVNSTYKPSECTFTITVAAPFTGGDVTFAASTDKGNTTAGAGSITKNGVTFACSNGILGNGTEYRLYKDSQTTISTSAGKITKIVFTQSGTYSISYLTPDAGSLDGLTWTGCASSVVFTASAQARASQIVVTVDLKADPELSFDESASFNAVVGEEFTAPTLANPHELIVYYESDNEDVATVDAATGAVTIVGPGEATITAKTDGDDSYSEGSASYTIKVTAANQIATPVITLGAENFFESTTATITCETAGVTILYSTDRGETWKTYTDVLTLTETTTLVAKAKKEGATDSPVSEAVTASKYSVLEGLAGMAANATTKSQTSYVKLSNAQVTARAQSGNGGEMQDATTGVLLYNSSFVAGKLYNGIFSVTYVLFQGNPEITAIEAVEGEGTITDASSEVEPALVTLQELVENFSTYLHKKIIIVGATVTTALENKGATIKQNGVEMALRENNSTSVITKLTKDAEVNVVGYPAIYSSKQQIYIYSDDDISAIVDQRADSKLALGALNSTTLNVGDKIQLNYTSDSNGDITWSTSNDNVLTVDQQGNLEAVAVGEATITLTQSETDTYKAGKATIKLTVVDPNQGQYLWLLSEASYSSASADQVTWTSDYATMVIEKANAGTNANNYLGGNYTSTRFYAKSILTIARVEGYRIASVLFQATTENYATTFKNSTWTNVAEPTLDSKSVILTPTDGMEPIVATIGGTCGFDKVQVIYVKTDEVVKKAANLAFAETTFNVEPEADFTAPELTTAEGFDGTVVYSSSDADIALVDETTGEVLIGDKEGVVTITATSAETDNFKAGSASYTITVKAPEKAEPEISFAEAIYTVNIGEEFTAPALINPHGLTVTYSCDNVEIALVDETTGDVVLDTQAKATVTITATFAGDETYKAGSASYTIKIVDPTEDEFDLTIASYETATVDKVVWDGGMASMVLAKSSSKTPANNYLGGDYDHTRVYKEQLLTITSEAKEIVSIQLLSNNSSADQLLIDNANYCATSESNSDLTYVAPEGFRATSVTFNISSAARLTKVVVTYADHTVPGTYVREELTAGNWGTICLPYDARVDGATLYTLAGIDDKDTPSKMYLSEAENLEAGKPYFFQATANTLTATYISGVASKAQSVNGLVGTLEAIIPDAEADPLEGMYLLSGGKIIKCGTGCSLAANRAYINMNQVSVYDGETAGVKVFNLGGEDGISRLDAATEGAVIYDLSGRRVSKTAKGLYIINGKKVSVK